MAYKSEKSKEMSREMIPGPAELQLLRDAREGQWLELRLHLAASVGRKGMLQG